MAESTASRIVEVSEIDWQAMLPGILAKPLWSDAATKRRAQLTRFESGSKLGFHRHDGDEILYVIEGAIADEFGTVTAGNIGYRPNGCVHSVTSKHGATVFALISGGVSPAKEGDSGPASKIIKLNEIASETLFIAGTPQTIGIDLPEVRVSRGGSFHVSPVPGSGVLSYGVRSFLEDEAAEVQTTPEPLRPRERAELLVELFAGKGLKVTIEPLTV